MASPIVTASHRHETRIAGVVRWVLFLAAICGLLLTGFPVVLR
jgi:hypothetical protein